MKTIEMKLRGNPVRLLCNNAAIFEMQDALGKDLNAALNERGKKGVENLYTAALIMAEQGEAYRAYLGKERGKVIPREFLEIVLSPYEVLELKEKVFEAINAGYEREIEEEEKEIDLGLLELKKKEGKS